MGEKNEELAKNTSETRAKNVQVCREEYTNGQILMHNVPLLSMYVLGTIIIGIYSLLGAFVFIIYLIISNLLFMVLICAFCPHYGTRTSNCGYGLVTKRLAKRKSPRRFNIAFKRSIVVLFPNWFAPLIIGIYLLWLSFNLVLLILLIIFILIAFIGVLYVSKSKSCNTCKLRKNCPWMSLCGKLS